MRAIHLSPLLVLLALPACGNGVPQLSGDSVGQYMVQATLTENECGAGHPAPPALAFYVELRHLEGTTRGYWKLPDGPEVDGALERNADFRFMVAEEVVGLPADASIGYVGCNIGRTETIQGALLAAEVEEDGADAGVVVLEEESAFTGTTTVRIDPMPGGDCTPLVALYGGSFATLPCTIEYELDAERLPEPLF